MFVLILLVYLAFRNSVRAKLKGLNGWLWAGTTVISFVASLFIGCAVVIYNFCADSVNLDQLSSIDPAVRLAASKQLEEVLNNNPLHAITIELFGIGGYLLIRYILDKKPNKKEAEIHWMDKLGENR
jgi:hypothetical protein